MKRISIIFASCIIALLLAGCVQQQVVQVATEPQEPQPAQQPQVQPQPQQHVPQPMDVVKSTPVTQTAPSQPMAKEQKKIADFRTSAQGKVKSFKYIFRDIRSDPSITFPFDGQYYVKGDLMKVVILTPDTEISARQANVHDSDVVLYKKQLYGENYFDAIYFNTNARTALGVCEDRKLCSVPGKQIQLDYNAMYKKTPLDWLLEVDPLNAKIVEEKMIENRIIDKVQYLKDGKPVLLWIEQYSGLPIEVDYTVADGTTTTLKYESLAVNTVTDSDKLTPIN